MPYLQRRRAPGRGSGGGNVSVPECQVGADADNVIADGENVIVFKCNPFDVVVDADIVCVGDFTVTVGL